MSWFAKAKKEDLRNLATELGEVVNDNMKIIDLKNLIMKNKDYEENFVKGVLETIVNERLEAAENKRRELEKEQQEQLRREEREERLLLEKVKEEREKRLDVIRIEELKLEQMRRAQEEHKKRLQAEEQKRVLEEQQRLMEEELERQKNEQQLYQLQQRALMEQENQKDFTTQSEMNILQSNSPSFVSSAMNIMPPPPTVLISNIPPPPPSMIPSSHSTIAPSVQVSAPPTRFPPPFPVNISAPPAPAQPFMTQLGSDTNSKAAINDTDADNDISEMDTSENTDIKLPQALEKVLALKTERAQQLGIDPDAVVQPVPATEEKVPSSGKSSVVTLVSVDEDEYAEEEEANKKESKSRRRKKKKKKRHNKVQDKNENHRRHSEKSKETSVDIDIEYVQEVIDITDPMYTQFMKIFEKFKLTEGEKEKEDMPADAGKEASKEETLNPLAFRKKPMDLDDDDEDQDEDKKEEEKPKLSKRKLKKLSRMTVAELKQKVGRPELVEMYIIYVYKKKKKMVSDF